jgi:hypothetical protein
MWHIIFEYSLPPLANVNNASIKKILFLKNANDPKSGKKWKKRFLPSKKKLLLPPVSAGDLWFVKFMQRGTNGGWSRMKEIEEIRAKQHLPICPPFKLAPTGNGSCRRNTNFLESAFHLPLFATAVGIGHWAHNKNPAHPQNSTKAAASLFTNLWPLKYGELRATNWTGHFSEFWEYFLVWPHGTTRQMMLAHRTHITYDWEGKLGKAN